MAQIEIESEIADLGVMTGSVTYTPGYAGTWWQPPEAPEIESCSLRDAFGTLIPESMVFEQPDRFRALMFALLRHLEQGDTPCASDPTDDMVRPF